MGRWSFSAFLLICFFLPLSSSADLQTDAAALLAFKENLDIKNNSTLASWNSSSTNNTCTDWTGIVCNSSSSSSSSSSSQRVIAVRLPNASLSGQIRPSTLGLLDALQTLSLTSNQFYGELPSDLANCTSLKSLLLGNNSFSGPLPASAFSSWPLLVQIDLSFNKFNGSIPQSIKDAGLLQSVNLQNNSFSGSIPEVTSPDLESFNVANNELEGQIPSSLSKFSAPSFAGNGDLCGKPLNVTCSAGTTSSLRGNKAKLSDGAIVGIVIGTVLGGCLILLLFGLIVGRKPNGRVPSARVNPSNNLERGAISSPQGPNNIEEEVERGEPRLVFVDDDDTKNKFDVTNLLEASAELLGNGSLGPSYKAMLETTNLENELIVVVKRLNFKYKSDYGRHLNVLATLRHENLVSIKAWYFFEDEKLVVYEYIHGSSLHSLLHGEAKMDWEKRLRVVGMVANGIAYMHARHVVHGNIKSSNVVIDSHGEARVTNHGLVQLAVNLPLNSAARNIGYTAPEILNLTRTTAKGDVYSFGVLLLELLTGRSPLPIAGHPNGAHIDLPRWVQSVVREQWTAEVFDLEIMKFEYIQEEMMQLLQIALPCVSPSPDQRPSMSDLVIAIGSLSRSDDDESVASL